MKYLSTSIVDNIVVFLSRLRYCGVPKKHGIRRPKEGPFLLKEKTGRTPTIDVGAMKRIGKGKIKVNRWNNNSHRIRLHSPIRRRRRHVSHK